jgi:hypothetical protein
MLPVLFTKFFKKIVLYFIKPLDQKAEFLSIFDNSTIIKLIEELPVLFRSIIQSVGFWIVELYSGLLTFKIDSLKELDPSDLIFSIVLIVFGLFGQISHSSHSWKKIEWLSNVIGNVTFFRGFFLLVFAVIAPPFWGIAHDFFSDPLWIWNFELRTSIVRNLGIINTIVLAVIFGAGLKYSIGIIRNQNSSKETRELAWGLCIISLYILTIPIYILVGLTYFIYEAIRGS